jgi:hypothetical protein
VIIRSVTEARRGSAGSITVIMRERADGPDTAISRDYSDEAERKAVLAEVRA